MDLKRRISIAATQSNSSKRGTSYTGSNHGADYRILLSSGSPITWYYTWSPSPAPSDIFPDGTKSNVEFVPTLHGIDSLESDIEHLSDLPDSSRHLFTFNEPDGTTDSGGSGIAPGDAAKAYINQIVPLRGRFQISHPSVTGSPRGLEWLNDFNSSCWDIDSENGCPADFVVAHWYGDFGGLSSSGSGLNGEDRLRIWVSELGQVQADQDTTFAMMKQTLPYLDQLEYIEKYAWFGVFRPGDANQWTGDGLSLFQDDGGLSELGAYYLGGQANGFEVGQQGETSGSEGSDDGFRASSLFAVWIMAAVTCFWNS
ncbi:glycosyl hydrolase catalytic core-domain-containing protein [Xylariaceae sp. FL0662B]|nr:glycosyl hydrolase catalytic core-domain-containing protein [Xylariaceae sp. FL0662B]